MSPIDPVEPQTNTEDRVGTVERMMEQARALDAEAAAARVSRPQQPPSEAPSSAFEPLGRNADARLRGPPSPASRAEEQARARELDRLNQPGNRPVTEGLRQRTAALQEARGALDERNRQMADGLARLGPNASPEVRQRFRDSFRNDPAHRTLVDRERAAAQDLATYLRTNADAFAREFPARPDAPAGSEERVMRGHGSNVAFHALSALANSSEAGSAIELTGRLRESGMLSNNRAQEVLGVAGSHAYLERVRNGETAANAERSVVEQLRAALPPGTLTRDVERTATSFRDLLGGLDTAQGPLRSGLSVMNAVHDVVKALEGAREGRPHEAVQDGLRAVTDGAEALRDVLRLGGRASAVASHLDDFMTSGAGRQLGAIAGGIGVVNNLRDLVGSRDWRYAAAAVGEAAQGIAALHPASRFLRLAGAAGSLVSNVARNGAQADEATSRLMPHLTAALGNERAAQVFVRNPRAIQVMREAGLSEQEIIRRASDPNARFVRHPSDVDQLRDLLRRERAGRR